MTDIQILPDSHTDHVDAETLSRVVAEASERLRWMEAEGLAHPPVLKAVVTLPEGQTLPCNLTGPHCGQAAVSEEEVVYRKRPGRDWPSRLLEAPREPVEVGFVTVIAGPHAGHRWVLYTVVVGPAAPKELDDPSLEDGPERSAAAMFWANHALIG